jgi:microcystin-dependent protein
MTVSNKHKFVSAKGDGPDATIVRPSNWNSEHDLLMAGSNVLGRTAAGQGPVTELAAGAYGLSLLAAATADAFNALAGTMPVGAVMSHLSGTTPPGWVRANGNTISSLAGVGSEMHAAVCLNLFVFLYTNFPDTVCPVSGGRSGNAVNDFNANKTLRLPDMRGRAPRGDDAMGAAVANVNPGGTIGVTGGAATRSIAVANLPASPIAVSGSTDQSGSHAHTYDRTSRTAKTAASGSGVTINEADPPTPNNTGTTGLHIHPFTGATANLGSGTPLNTMDPYFVLFYFIKL